MASIRAIFVDLDGTLLNPEHTVSAYAKRVLATLRASHPTVELIVATGRPFPDVAETIKEAGLAPSYTITSNGAVVHDNRSGEVVRAHHIPASIVQRLLAVNVEAENGNPDVENIRTMSSNMFRAEEWLCNYKIERLGKSYRPSFQPQVTPDLKSRTDLHTHVHSFFYYGPHENLLPAERTLNADFSSHVDFCFSLPHILDISPKGLNKGVAVKEVAEYLGVPLTETIAFGDGMNDMEMLDTVGQGFIMGNGFPALKAARPHLSVVASNAEDGVARKIAELFQLQLAE